MVCILSIDGAPKNCGVVKMDIEFDEVKIISADILNFCGDKKVKQVKFEDMMKSLIESLDKINLHNVNLVLIENIPSRLNPTTKSLSIAMYTYFMLKKLDVKLVSPSRKLSKEQNKLSYKQRKAEGVKKCMDMLRQGDKDLFNLHEKVDDCADCVLQAVEYLKKQKKRTFRT